MRHTPPLSIVWRTFGCLNAHQTQVRPTSQGGTNAFFVRNKKSNPTFERISESVIEAWDAREGIQVTSTRVLISLTSLILHWPCALQFSGGTDGILAGRRWQKWDPRYTDCHRLKPHCADSNDAPLSQVSTNRIVSDSPNIVAGQVRWKRGL